MNGFSGNLFDVRVYNLEVGDVSFRVVFRNAVLLNCTCEMTIVFFYYSFQTSPGFSYVRKVAIFFMLDHL